MHGPVRALRRYDGAVLHRQAGGREGEADRQRPHLAQEVGGTPTRRGMPTGEVRPPEDRPPLGRPGRGTGRSLGRERAVVVPTLPGALETTESHRARGARTVIAARLRRRDPNSKSQRRWEVFSRYRRFGIVGMGFHRHRGYFLRRWGGRVAAIWRLLGDEGDGPRGEGR